MEKIDYKIAWGALLKRDDMRLNALSCVAKINLPDCFIAAGFLRNLVWDHLHGKATATPLNDVDVIYFDANESDPLAHLNYEAELSKQMPECNWQVKNQAYMHVRNNDRPYTSSLDAMSFWPEKETAVAIRQTAEGEYECVSAFGFGSLFKLKLTHNPKRAKSIFEHRIESKDWLTNWPLLQLNEM